MTRLSKSTVSVVMAAHNAERTISHAVTTVLNQTFPDFELIVCDDASQDGTIATLRRIDDPRLRIIANEANLGPGASRDRAMKIANGKWIAFIDADDGWHADRLEALLAAACEDPDCLVFDDLLLCHDAGGALVPWKALHGPHAFGSKGQLARDIRLENYIVAPRLIIKPLFPRRFFSLFGVRHSDRRFGEDAEFIFDLAAKGAKLRYVPNPLYFYRITPGSLTTAATSNAMRNAVEASLANHSWPPDVQHAFQRKIANLRLNEALHDFSNRLREADLIGGARLLSAEPALLKALPHRSLSYIRYQIHRLMHGGLERRQKK